MATDKLILPKGYAPRLSVRETQKGIKVIKDNFQRYLAVALNLERVSAPLFVTLQSGFNDNLSGVERPVQFDLLDMPENEVQIVQSLAKWKRWALGEYGFEPGRGLYTDMNAIRRDEELDNIHSIYVDQWDWEKVITRKERNLDYLKDVAQKIVNVICDTNELLKVDFPELKVNLKRDMLAITTSELEEMYPDLSPKEREDAITKKHGTVLLMQIGGKLKSGKPHDGRAPDYDDWELNGDILFYNEVLGHAFEISSMGIRVDEESLDRQLTERGCNERRVLPFHKALLAGELPLTVGGGIGQSRLCMLMMGSAHIGEVQSSIWDKETLDGCRAAGIRLL